MGKIKSLPHAQEYCHSKNLEENYYNNFITSLIASFEDVEVEGFEIVKNVYEPHPLLTISELPPANTKEAATLFSEHPEEKPSNDEAGKIVFDLSFKYGKYRFRGDSGDVSVSMEKKDNDFIFHRIKRNINSEKLQADADQVRIASFGNFQNSGRQSTCFFMDQ